MAKKYLANGRIFLEDTSKKALSDGAILTGASGAAPTTGHFMVDRALLREPNLWVPGKMPVGSVKLDRSHVLADRVLFCLFPSGHGLRDLSHGLEFSSSGVTMTPKGANFTAASSRISAPLLGQPDIISAFETGITLLFIVHGTGYGTSGFGRLMQTSYSVARAMDIYYRSTSSGITWREGLTTGIRNFTPSGFSPSARNIIMFDMPSTSEETIHYRNTETGAYDIDNGNLTPLAVTNLDGTDDIIIGNRIDLDRSFLGLFEFVVAIEGGVPDDIDLFHDPYQLLIPA